MGGPSRVEGLNMALTATHANATTPIMLLAQNSRILWYFSTCSQKRENPSRVAVANSETGGISMMREWTIWILETEDLSQEVMRFITGYQTWVERVVATRACSKMIQDTIRV